MDHEDHSEDRQDQDHSSDEVVAALVEKEDDLVLGVIVAAVTEIRKALRAALAEKADSLVHRDQDQTLLEDRSTDNHRINFYFSTAFSFFFLCYLW